MPNGPKTTEVAERHIIFLCVDDYSRVVWVLMEEKKNIFTPETTESDSFLTLFLFCFVDKYSVLRGLKRAREGNAICHFYHLKVIWLLGHEKQQKVYVLTVLFVVFFYSSPNFLNKTSPSSSHTPIPFVCPSHPSSRWHLVCCRAQAQGDGPSAGSDEPCHEPRSDITLTLRPASNHLSPACCAPPLDSSLRHTFAIPSRTVFCQH